MCILCIVAGISAARTIFLYFSAVILIMFCIYYLLLEIYQLLKRGYRKYFANLQNYFEVATYMCVLVFVFPFLHECWCYPSWKWQSGALAIFLAMINNFVLLQHIPYVGNPITMLFNVYVNFLLLLYLPILLIFTFGLPFYMLFIATPDEVCC